LPSRITSLHVLYGKYNEILPEELLDNTNNVVLELRRHATLLEEIIKEDTKFIEKIIQVSGLKSPLSELSCPEMIIRWTFEPDDRSKRKSELLKESLAQWLICKYTLPLLSCKILDELPLVISTYVDYREQLLTSRNKRIAFVNFTRHYQNFIGYSANIRDIIDEYHDTFNIACKQIDSNYEIDYIWRRSAVFTSHLKQGVVELLLRGYLGRFTPFPLLRSYMEVLITRTLLNTEYSNKYRGKNIVMLKGFKSADIWNLMRTMNAGSDLQVCATSLLYDWGSMSVHRAIRTPHSLMWYSLIFTDILNNMLAGIKIEPEQLDNIIDKLVTDNKVTLS
jgi:hypothetical protein